MSKQYCKVREILPLCWSITSKCFIHQLFFPAGRRGTPHLSKVLCQACSCDFGSIKIFEMYAGENGVAVSLRHGNDCIQNIPDFFPT